jgi:lysophospholipase L1-like esterase
MRIATLLVVLLIPFTRSLHAQCNEASSTKVLLVGDSWAFFMGVDQTINTVLQRWGHSGYTYYTNLTLAENGAETDDFLTASKQAEIQNRLLADPGIKVVHLSIGGNDVLGDWNVSFTQEQTDSLKAAVYDRLLQVIAFIKGVRPDIHILWSGYCYPNFEEVIQSFQPFPSLHPFYGTWQGMGFPSFEQLNTLLNTFSAEMEAYCATDPRVDFVTATGLMQHTFGQNTPLGVAPGGSYPPGAAPLPEGFVDYPSPRNSMRDYLLTKDCFHLSASGYRDMIDYHTRKFYHKFLMDDQYLLAEEGALSGTVTNFGNTPAELRLGEEGGETHHLLLSFDTTVLPDTGIAGASIFLRREALQGNNPVGGTVQVKVKNGHFGPTPQVEALDFFATADASDQACRFGDNGGNGRWIRIDLPASLLPFIANGARTQFILSTGTLGGLATWTGTDDPELAPVLNLRFGALSTPVAAHSAAPVDAVVHPNPTSGPLFLSNAVDVLQWELCDAAGRLVLSGGRVHGNLDLSAVPEGLYILRTYSTAGIDVHRVLRER